MIRNFSLVAVIVLTAASLSAQSVPSAESLIRGYEEDLGRAMIQHDVSTLSRLVAEDWTIQNDTGVTGTRSGFLSDIQTGKLAVKSFRLHDLRIRVFGDVAVVQGFDDEQTVYDGKPGAGTYDWLDVWVRRDGAWRSIATQLTRVTSTH